MKIDLLRDDCSRCAALCCVALAFDKSEFFALDKPAGKPCRHIDQNAACAIHAMRTEAGFSGCTSYSCHGAGQRVVQECFDGQDWRNAPHFLARMMSAFQIMRAVHDLLLLLTEAQKLPLAASDQVKSEEFLLMLAADERISEDWLKNIDLVSAQGQIHAFLQTLRTASGGLATSKSSTESASPGMIVP